MVDVSPSDLDLVARTILAEGGSDRDAGMAAVANVIKNRVQSGQFGASIPTVVYQPNAFSAWSLNRRDPNYPGGFSTRDPNYQHAYEVAQSVFNGQSADPTRGSLYYYNPTLQAQQGRQPPSFAAGQPLATIGRQQFYGEPSAPSVSGFTGVSPGDVTDTARSLGLSIGSPDSQKYAPVSSGGGVTISVPTGGATPPTTAAPTGALPAVMVNPADIDDTAKSLGLSAAPTAMTVAQTQQPPPALPPGVTPEIESAAQRIAPYYGAQGFGEGMPVIGPVMNAASAALMAAFPGMKSPGGAQYPPGATFGQRFAQNQAVQDEAYRLWAQQHAIAAPVEGLAGAGLALGPVAQTSLGAAALGLPNATRLGATLGGQIYTGAAGGTLIGGLDAALRGQSPVTGAELGAAGGVLGPLAGAGVGRAVSAILPHLTEVDPALRSVNTIGRNWLSDALANETPASIAAARTRMGPQGFLADINPAMTELAAGISNRAEGDPSTLIAEGYRARQAAQRGTINAALDNAFGPRTNIPQMTSLIEEDRANAADPLYEQWRSMQVHPTAELQGLIPRLETAGAFDQAKYLAGIDGININKNFFVGGPQKEFPTTQTWDYVKRALDSKIDQAYAGGDNTTARSLGNLRSQLIGAIEKTSAGDVWKDARAAFASRSALLDQIRAGHDDFLGSRSGLSADELREELRGLSGPELQARLVGQRAAADETMGATMNGDTTLRNKFLAPNNQEKLQLSLGAQRASDLVNTLEQQRYLSEQAKYVNPRAGSPTAPRTAAMRALEPPPLPAWNPNITEPLSFIPPHAIEALRPSNILQGGREQAYAQARQQIAPILMQSGNSLKPLLDAIQTGSISRALAQRRGAAANALVTRLITGPGSQTARQQGGFSLPSSFAPAL